MTVLFLSNNRIREIEAIINLTNLAQLSLANNQIIEIDAIANLVKPLVALFKGFMDAK